MRKKRPAKQYREDDMSFPNNAQGTRMATEIETSATSDGKRHKVKVLFYMNDSVIKELKRRAVDQNKRYSQLAEDLIIAGLHSNEKPGTS